MATRRKQAREIVHLGPSRGRVFAMGPLSAIFKADGAETAGRYAISEWWLEPRTKGPGAHAHEEDDVFYVLEGTMTFLVQDRWVDAPKGSFLLVPGGATHDFENRTGKRAGMLNVSVPGGFEEHMPPIAEWFRRRPARDAATRERPARAPARAQRGRATSSKARSSKSATPSSGAQRRR